MPDIFVHSSPDDPRARPLIEELTHEYTTRYGDYFGEPSEEMSRYPAALFAPPDGAYDAQLVATFADEQCSQAFATYVGVTYDKSKYYFLHLAPSAESWKEQGDRDVVCLLFQQGTTLTGSAQGTAQ